MRGREDGDDLTIVRFPGFMEGQSLDVPCYWVLYDTETRERTIEQNPEFVYRQYEDVAFELGNLGPYVVEV